MQPPFVWSSYASLTNENQMVILHPKRKAQVPPKPKDMRDEIDIILNEFNSLGIAQQLDYEKFYLYSIVTHSTAIEGSTVTEIENQILFDEGIGSNKPMVEQLMNLDLKKAYVKGFEYAGKHADMTIELLRELSSIVMQNTGSEYRTIAGDFSSSKGDLRLLNVSAGRGGRSYLAWQKIPDRLKSFCDWLNEERRRIRNPGKPDAKQVYELSFEAHYRLVGIHPWADGNGRMSRLVMNMIQYEAGAIPSIVMKDKRVEYIQSLEESEENGSSKPFIEFMLAHHIENLKRQMEEYKASLDSTHWN